MHSTQLQEVNITIGGIMNGDTKCSKNIGMKSMVKVNLPGKLMKIITLSETLINYSSLRENL